MYIVAPMVKGGMHYIRVGLIYKPHGLFAGNIKRCATFLRTFFNRCQSEIDVTPSQAYFLHKRRGVGPLYHPMLSWICVDTLISCPGVVDKEGADTIGVHSLQAITFRMMITTLTSSMASRRGHMYSYHWSSSTAETLGLFGGQQFFPTLMGYGSGSR